MSVDRATLWESKDGGQPTSGGMFESEYSKGRFGVAALKVEGWTLYDPVSRPETEVHERVLVELENCIQHRLIDRLYR